MVTQVKVTDSGLTFVSRSVRGEHTRENLMNAHNKASKARKVRAQLKKEAIERSLALPIDRAIGQRNERLLARLKGR